ncbi:EAL domain-containing protein [uncultured Pseudomonas sp.]|uniref:putative bifunctional diguanylate cyclase/phosphodiesterase n=1 Tax=uncultured Pseudomonas sp. TaxID=114707 RepID=UPI0025FCACBD|nr:EAL domain-containing protein [uncultured Pseudomonas sp.]
MECANTNANDGNAVLLVVDDYPENLVTMQAVLQRADWCIVTASSGFEALNVLLEREVDLVLLDVQMPGMDGFEVARLMRGSQRTRLTPIIFLTANEQSQEAVHRGYANGATDYLFKPFDPHVLRPKVQALLEQQRNRRALQKLTQELDAARAFNASVLSNVAEGILVVDEQGSIRFANPAICRLLDLAESALDGSALLDHFSYPKAGHWLESGFHTHYRRGETWRVHDATLLTRTGGQLPVAFSCAPLPTEQKGMVLSILDMSVERDLYRQLEQQAVTDALTGLLNRRGLFKAVDSMLPRNERAGKCLAVLYLDLDGFKRINDSLGHESGDQVLLWVAGQLRECMRPYDVLARIGGDEFVVVIEGLEHAEQAAKVAEKLIERVSVRRHVDGVDVTLGVSIGISTHPACGAQLDDLLRVADTAMYEAKRAGRQQYRFYDQSMNGRARSRLMLEEGIRSAIKDQQFSVIYQPQVYAVDGRLRGFEAILHWQHPLVGDVPRDLFMPLLEETRLINRLGDWMFDQSTEQRHRWNGVFDADLVMSVGISASQFCLPSLATELQAAMQRHGIAPGQLEVEISETALVHNLNHSRRQLQQLHDIGVRVSLDDFGAGDCSLAHLRNLELDTLKFDRHFIETLLDCPRDMAMASSVIELAHRLNILVVADGVTRVEQLRWLVEQGCHLLQGALLAAPLSAAQAQDQPRRMDLHAWNLSEPSRPR